MLEHARAAGVPFARIAGEGMYGGAHAIRQWSERHGCGYGLTVTSDQRPGLRPVTDWIEGLGEADWQRLSAGDAARGPSPCDGAHRPHAGGAAGFRCGSLVRRSIADPREIGSYLTRAPEIRPLIEAVITRHDLEPRQPFRWSEWRPPPPATRRTRPLDTANPASARNPAVVPGRAAARRSDVLAARAAGRAVL